MFNDLPLFQDAKLEIEALRPSIAALGEIICKYNLEDQIGVNLLHRHFNLEPNELVVKTTYCDHAVVAPQSRVEGVIPYMFSVTQDGFEPVEYLSEWNESAEGVSLGQSTLAGCDELRQAVFSLDVADKLGFFIRHQSFDALDDSAWIEDMSQKRQLTIRKRKKSDSGFLNSTETNWYFTRSPEGQTVGAGVLCGICCMIHCGIHCGWHG